MPINILMPALSPTMEKGNLAKWHVKEGDKVASGDVIAEIETDKATMEVEAVDEGTIARILVGEGTADVPVNDIIAVLAGEGEDAKAAGAAPTKAAPKPETSPGGTPGTPGSAPEDARAPSTAAPSEGGSGSPASAPKGNGHDKAAQDGRVFASPLARRLAREGRIDIAAIAGSGPHGRIVQRDVETALKDGVKTTAAAPAQASSAAPAAGAPQGLAIGMSDETIRKLFEPGSFEVVPHDGMRKTIARRLVEAKQTIPHFYVSADCRIDRLLALRAEINAAAPVRKGEKGDVPAYKLSVNDLVIKALAQALRLVPDANVTWTNEGMLKHARVDVGVAVSIPGGLITPVVRNADAKSLSAISNEMKSLAKRARDRKLKPEEYQGGTTAVSNLGMFGVKQFQAIVNPPHATILAVGAGEERAVVDKGQIAVGTVMTATLSTDHRAVDGALAAELLAAFRRLIENPAGMLA